MKNFVKSYAIVCAAALFLPQMASANQVGKYTMGHHKHKRHASTVMTMSGSQLDSGMTGKHVMTKWSRGSYKSSGVGSKTMKKSHKGKPMMSRPHYVFFGHDSSRIDSENAAVIKRAYDEAKMHNSMKIKISGHTSAVGNKNYNMKLSARRAAAVRNALTNMGVHESRVATAAFGETIPYDRQSRMPNAQKDRRVEIRYVYRSHKSCGCHSHKHGTHHGGRKFVGRKRNMM